MSFASAQATSISLATATNSFLVAPVGGARSCGNSGAGSSACAAADPGGRASVNASATARAGYVSASLNGGSIIHGSYASASSVATAIESYLFTGGTGAGTVTYSVALSGASTGNPANPSTVLFNGASYSVLPNAAPTNFSFTQSFIYGQPFLLTLSIDLRGSWNGSAWESGSRAAAAELKWLEISGPPSSTATVAAPEPSAAIMWIGGVLLILAGSRMRPKQR